MRIGISGSMHHTESLLAAQEALRALGHAPFVSAFAPAFLGQDDDAKERIKLQQKNEQDAIREFWHLMQGADAVLVMNLARHGIANYIGGNTFLEIGFAHVLGQKIFLFNPIPDIRFYRSEIEAMQPIVIHGDYSRIL